MNVLSIGNSFSQDAHRYLHAIAKADGVELHTFNLYIGGCSLSRHYRNMLSRERAYTLGLTWYRFLTGNDIQNNAFAAFDEEVTAEEMALAKKCVTEVAARYGV